MYRGRRYLVSCRQLGAVRETKEDSYQLANLWWQAKKIEIDGQHPNAARILEQQRRIQWAQQHNRTDLIQELRNLIAQLENDMDCSESVPAPSLRLTVPAKESGVYRLSEMIVFGNKAKDDLASLGYQSQEEARWEDRLSREPERPSIVPQDRSVANQVGRWIEDLRLRANTGQFGHGELRGQIAYIKHFAAFLGEQTLIDTIDEERWAE